LIHCHNDYTWSPLPCSYAELFVTFPDILEGEYTTYLASLCADAPAALWDTILTTDNSVPKVFLVMANDQPEVKVILCPTKFALTLGPASQWDNNNLAFASGVGAGNQIALMRVPAMAEMENTVRMPPKVPIAWAFLESWLLTMPPWQH